MSLGVVVKGSSGVVLSADTRVTLAVCQKGAAPAPVPVIFDNTPKLLTLGDPHKWFASVTYGDTLIGTRTAHSYMPEFEHEIGKERLTIDEYASRLSAFFVKRWNEAVMSERTTDSDGISFIVSGYDEGKPYGTVRFFSVPGQPIPEPRSENGFGVTWGGEVEIANRVVQGYDPGLLSLLTEEFGLSTSGIQRFQELAAQRLSYKVPYDELPLQDCIDLAVFLIRTTMTAQDLAVTSRGVGGMIEVAAITRKNGLRWIQRRELRGEKL